MRDSEPPVVLPPEVRIWRPMVQQYFGSVEIQTGFIGTPSIPDKIFQLTDGTTHLTLIHRGIWNLGPDIGYRTAPVIWRWWEGGAIAGILYPGDTITFDDLKLEYTRIHLNIRPDTFFNPGFVALVHIYGW